MVSLHYVLDPVGPRGRPGRAGRMDHGVEAAAPEGDVVGLESPRAPTRPMAGGGDRCQVPPKKRAWPRPRCRRFAGPGPGRCVLPRPAGATAVEAVAGAHEPLLASW